MIQEERLSANPVRASQGAGTMIPFVWLCLSISPYFQRAPSERGEAPEAALAPQLVTLAVLGGAGDQWIQEVGFLPDGKIYGKSGGGHFTVVYAASGAKCLGISGNIHAASTGPQGEVWANGGSTTKSPAGSSLTIGFKQVGKNLQQPYLSGTFGWTWWGWTEKEAGSLRADSRGVRVHFLTGGRFLAKCWTDGGNSTLTRDPRDPSKPNPATTDAAVLKGAGGSATLYIVGDEKTGSPLCGTFMKHRPQAEAFDAFGRFYVAQHVGDDSKSGPKGFGLGGDAGFCVMDPALSCVLFTTSLGPGRATSIAVRHGICVLGGVVPADSAGALQQRNPAQPKAGGGQDGFLAIIRME
jgi:hypothetical protein